MYIDLYKELTEEDKKRLNSYIDKFGVSLDHFIGLENWLQDWSHANQKLYKLLGNKLIHEIDYYFEKNHKEIKAEVYHYLFTLNFKKSYEIFCNTVIHSLYLKGKIDESTKIAFNHIADGTNFIDDKIYEDIKFKKEDSKRQLQIQKGMKPIKALQKIVVYFKDDFQFIGFEEFRLAHSRIFNTKRIKGKLCFSIHPFDFITMSDNASGWTSCMNWKETGCYHVGTIEMMNSNNVICCYLKGNDEYRFGAQDYEVWNNKKWRDLCYITKDIIMSGKAYPYAKEELSKAIISEVKELAKKNLNWEYKYGPELYQDMKYINSTYTVDRARIYLRYKNVDLEKKHNIIWDTKGMYNDMLNDHNTEYWCYRNKVNKTKVLSVSGKANCICCNDSIIYLDEDYYDSYNERYNNCGSSICRDCFDSLVCCSCHEAIIHDRLLNVEGDSNKICENCYKEYVRICPCCGKPMLIKNRTKVFYPYNIHKDTYDIFAYPSPWDKYTSSHSNDIVEDIEAMYICESCFNKVEIKKFFIEKEIERWGLIYKKYYIFNRNLTPLFNTEDYFFSNLKKPKELKDDTTEVELYCDIAHID